MKRYKAFIAAAVMCCLSVGNISIAADTTSSVEVVSQGTGEAYDPYLIALNNGWTDEYLVDGKDIFFEIQVAEAGTVYIAIASEPADTIDIDLTNQSLKGIDHWYINAGEASRGMHKDLEAGIYEFRISGSGTFRLKVDFPSLTESAAPVSLDNSLGEGTVVDPVVLDVNGASCIIQT